MSESILEFHLKYNVGRKNGKDVFIAMGEYISAYERFGKLISEAVGSEITFECSLEEVRKGSIIGKLIFAGLDLITSPNSFMEELTGEVGTIEQLTEITNKQEDILSKKMEESIDYRDNPPPKINKIDVAYAMEELSKANARLNDGELMTVNNSTSNNHNVIQFNPRFRFTGNISKMFSDYVGTHEGYDLLEVIKPCNQGDLTWRVKSRITGHEYNAPIVHKQWLENYQKGESDFLPRDYLEVDSRYEVYKSKGKEKIRDAKIIKIIDVVKNSGFQDELF